MILFVILINGNLVLVKIASEDIEFIFLVICLCGNSEF